MFIELLYTHSDGLVYKKINMIVINKQQAASFLGGHLVSGPFNLFLNKNK